MSAVFQLTPSRYSLCLLLMICSGALVCVGMVSLPIGIKGVLALGVMCHFARAIRRQRVITGFCYETHDRWQLFTRRGDTLSVEFQTNALVTRYLMVLNFAVIHSQDSTKHCTVLLFSDSLPPERSRFLRSRLS